ncbi:MAG: hypothetical protein KJN90_15180 [Gammaproteobacteria bacterium]|nr:hypothetical protein [Gammaproteobacteria bacterium]
MNDKQIRGPVNLIVALSCEARPLIQRFKLKQNKNIAGLRLYSNGDGVNLMVSGVGKLATATACGYLAGSQGAGQRESRSSEAGWLNIGIAGHRTLQVGEGALVHKVTDRSSGRVRYPPMVLKVQCPTTSVITVEHPETEYGEDSAYDMEASVFTDTAGRFATSELIQIFKVISDNPRHSVEAVTEQRISQWIEGQLDCIENIVSQMLDFVAEYNGIYAVPADYFELARLVRLTASQRTQLQSVCRRYYALGGESLIDQLDGKQPRSAKEMLVRLESLTDTL